MDSKDFGGPRAQADNVDGRDAEVSHEGVQAGSDEDSRGVVDAELRRKGKNTSFSLRDAFAALLIVVIFTSLGVGARLALHKRGQDGLSPPPSPTKIPTPEPTSPPYEAGQPQFPPAQEEAPASDVSKQQPAAPARPTGVKRPPTPGVAAPGRDVAPPPPIAEPPSEVPPPAEAVSPPPGVAAPAADQPPAPPADVRPRLKLPAEEVKVVKPTDDDLETQVGETEEEDISHVSSEEESFLTAEEEGDEEPRKPEEVKRPKVVPQAPAPVKVKLVDSLTASRFAPLKKPDGLVLQGIARAINEGDEVQFVQGGIPLLKEHLLDFGPGRMLDVSVLHAYSMLVQTHIKRRAAEGLQHSNCVLSPVLFTVNLRDWLDQARAPKLPEEVKAEVQAAHKVVFALSTPVWDYGFNGFTPGNAHFVVVVIDREHRSVHIVDSLPQPPPFYPPIAEYVRLLAEQMGDLSALSASWKHRIVLLIGCGSGDARATYSVSATMPEKGFPVQAEALPGMGILEVAYANACGTFALENVLCIAEERRPNFTAPDVILLRRRMLYELFNGLRDRGLENGDVRRAMK